MDGRCRGLWRGLGVGMALTAVVATLACSPKRYATDKLADALSGTGQSFRTEEDPELAREAAPFGLKLMESVLEQAPDHRELLTALAAQYTQYAFAFVQMPADEIEEADLAAARAGRERARKLYLRARGYGLRGLEVARPGFGEALAQDPEKAVALCGREEVPLLHWTAMAWAASVALSKDRPDALAELPAVEALASRVLSLDGGYAGGAPHTFFVAYEAARPGAPPGMAERVRAHYDRAVALSGGTLAAPHIALAEGWAMAVQDKAAFRELLGKALAVDPDAHPETRLENLLMQRRARWLLTVEETLFFE